MKIYFKITTILFLAVLLSGTVTAQQLIFDGEDDYAIAGSSGDLQISDKDDFTFEFFVKPGSPPKNGMALLSIHDGKFGIVCAIDGAGSPYLVIDNQTYQPEKASLPERCNHLVYTRKSGNLYLIIDGAYYGMGKNSSALANQYEVVIGNSPYTTAGFYNGSIEEIRLWKIYRSEGELEEYRNNCLTGEHEGLMAHWNIAETSGQFVNDMISNLHARWGDEPIADPADPRLEAEGCIFRESCCELKADFSTEGRDDHYTFVNQSNGGVYTWYIDGVVVSNATDLNHTFGTPGTYLITLEAKAKNGCKSKRTISLIVVFSEEIEFCGEYEKTYSDPVPFDTDNYYFDRFGNRYSAIELAIESAQAPSNPATAPQQKSLTSTGCDCQTDFGINTNHFELYFEDCELNTGSGFDDPTATTVGSTLGRDRRRTVCQVYADLSLQLTQNTATCGVANDKVRIKVMPSQANGYYDDGSNLSALPATVGGVASGYTMNGLKDGILEMMPWVVLNTGSDQRFSYDPVIYHGFIRINFTNFTSTWQVDHTIPVAANAVDLYSVALHESMHMLGMGSFLIFDGTNWLSRITGTATGGYARWDDLIKKAAGNLDILAPVSPYSYQLNPALALPGDLLNSCNGTDLWVGNNQAPLYTGNSSNYNPGSSMSHLDESCVTGSNYVLNPSISTGADKRTLSSTELQLFADLGYGVAGYSNCTVIGTDDQYGNCQKSFVVSSCPGSSITISTADLIANDINATGVTDVELINTTGTLQQLSPGSNNSDYVFTPSVNITGDYILRYKPVGCSGQTGNTTYFTIQTVPCTDCEFNDLTDAQSTNPFVLDNGPNCNNTPTSPKCVDCGFNKNPFNLVCNPEFCADDQDFDQLVYSHFECQTTARTNVPGWYRAIATPGYVGSAVNNSVGALYNEYPTPMHMNSGYMHNGFYVSGGGGSQHHESMYTNVSVLPGRRYFYSSYGNSVNHINSGRGQFDVYLLSSNFDPGVTFSCANSMYNLPVIPAADRLDVLHWQMTEHFIAPGSNNTFPFERNGSFVNVPASFNAAYLLLTNQVAINATSNTQIDIFSDQVELVEDDFTAGPDQTLTCGLAAALGGTDFGMLSDVKVQYTWTEVATGTILSDYEVERELDGTFIVTDLISSTALSQIPTVSVTPPVTTTYRLTRTFIPDTDGTFGRLPATVFNGIQLTDDVTVTVPLAPAANPAFTETISCNVVDFFSDPATHAAPFSHSWDVDGDGTWDYFTPDATHSYPANGIYTVIHEISNGCGTYVASQSVTITDHTLTMGLAPSVAGPYAFGDNFIVDVTITNIGTATINDIILEIPAGALSAGLSFTYSPTNIGSLSAGQSTVISVPVTVTGTCGSAQVCATITSANSACLLPLICTAPLEIQSNPPLDQALTVTSNISSTYAAPFVAGGLVEFDVTVSNAATTLVSNIDLNYLPNGLELLTTSPPNFSLAGGASTTFTVQAKVLDCGQFSLVSNIDGADDVCPGDTPTATAGDAVTPYTISVVVPEMICSFASNVTADVFITNPSSQTITDVKVVPTGSSNLFQNLSGNLNNLTLAPNTTTNASFTFESNGTTGSAFICAEIESIGTGTDLINYTCSDSRDCEAVDVVSGPYTVTLTASPVDGSVVCVNQSAAIQYTLEITNNLPVPLNNLTITPQLSGLTLNSGQSIPSSVNLGANSTTVNNTSTATFTFNATAITSAQSADVTIDVTSTIPGCTQVTAATSHPIQQFVEDVLQISAVLTTPGGYVQGQTVSYDVTVTNTSGKPVNDIRLDNFTLNNALINMSQAPLFSLPANSSATHTITAEVNDCTNFVYYAEITQSASTCGGIVQSGITNNLVSDLIVQMSPIDFVCSGGAGTVNLQVTNPAGQTLSGVHLNATGAASGSLFSSLGFSGPVTLNPGVNNLSFPIVANPGANGNENICVGIDQVGNIPYNCTTGTVCESVDVGNPVSVTVQTMPFNLTSVCPGQYVNFTVSFLNNHSAPVTLSYNNILTGASSLTQTPLTGNVTLNPGAYHNITYVTQITGGGPVASLEVIPTVSNIPGCGGSPSTLVSFPIASSLAQALDVTAVLTNTYPAPHVVGGQVEFDVTVANTTGNQLTNIDLNYSHTGLTNVTASPANFSLAGNSSTTFTVTGTVADCSAFDLTAAIAGASGTCGGTGDSEVVSGTVTPYGISMTSPQIACTGASALQGSVVITNPSGQMISDVNLSALQGSTLFQNVSAFSPVNLLPGANTINFTFDSNGSTGTENICVTIDQIGTGVNSIPYTCSPNSACDQTTITNNPVQISLTANPPAGTAICVDQNPLIDYTLTITNPTGTDLTGISINAQLTGLNLNAGQTIPATVSVLAGSTETVQFSATADNSFSSASVLIDVSSNVIGCSNASALINHPLYRNLNSALQVTVVPLTTGAFVNGQTVSYQVTVNNLTTAMINNIDLDYQFTGLVNTTASPANFSLGAGVSTSLTVTGEVDDCQQVDFTATVLSADQTCSSASPSATVQTAVSPFALQVIAPSFSCGANETVTVEVTNPSVDVINQVEIELYGNLIGGGQTSQTTNLQPGVNTLTFIVSTAGAGNSFETLCARITRIDNLPYTCQPFHPCTSIQIVNTPVAVSIQPTSAGTLCSSGVASFDVTISNTSGTNLNGITLSASGVSGFTPNALPGPINIPAGGTHTFVLDGQISATATTMGVCVDVQAITNIGCYVPNSVQGCVSNLPVNNLALPIEIEDAVTGTNGSLSLEVIYDMTIDDEGNLYAVGEMRGTQARVNGTTYTATNSCSFGLNPFVLKYDNNGVVWFKNINACGIPTGVATDADGNVFVSLNMLGDLSFAGSTHTLQGWYDFAILRYDNTGNEETFLAEGGQGVEYIADIKVNNGKIIVSGISAGLNPMVQPQGYTGTYSLGGQSFSYHNYVYQQNGTELGDGFVASYQYNPQSQSPTISNDWVDVIAAPIIPNKIAMEPNGNTYVIGAALETFTFPHMLPGGGGQFAVNSQYAGGIPAATSQPNVNIDIDAFIISYTATGNKRWGQLYGSPAMDYPESVTDPGNNSGSPYHQADIKISASGELYAAFQSYATFTGSTVAGSTLSFQNEMGSHIVNLDPATGNLGVGGWSVPAATAVSTTLTSTVNGTTYTQTIVGNTVISPSLAVDDQDQVYLTGAYYLAQNRHQSVDFYSLSGGPSPLNLAAGSYYELGLVTEKFDQNGGFLWAEPNRSFVSYPGPYHPSFPPGDNPLRPMDLEVNDCGLYQTVILDGTLDVGGTTYTGAPYDAFIFRIRETAGGLTYGRAEATPAPVQQEVQEATDMTVYPNPNRGRFTIDLRESDDEPVEAIVVFNTAGREMRRIKRSESGRIEIDLTDEVSGMYLVRLITKNGAITRSVMVTK